MSDVAMRAAYDLGPMPLGRAMRTVDEGFVRAPIQLVFQIVRDVEQWPAHLAHYRFVRFRERANDGGGIVEMAANRPFGLFNWPTWWLSEMQVLGAAGTTPAVRFRHIGGITKGMDVEWRFEQSGGGTRVELVHAWDGPRWPLIGVLAATIVIGPVFVHGIATRTLAGLARIAERDAAMGVARGAAPGAAPGGAGT
jgi:ribosome-associated toxin RatA of RatAB toxin-antitoxin module